MNTTKKRKHKKPYYALTPWIRNPLKPPKQHTYTIPYEYEAPPGPVSVRPGWAPARKPSKYKRKQKFPPPPYPTKEQVDDFAITIAINDNIVDKHILRMICWNPGDPITDIPERKRDKHFHAAQNRWTDALLLLRRCMEENHALMIRRIRRYGNKIRTRFWTSKPLKHGQTPPPRRRRYVPPIVLEKLATAPPSVPTPAPGNCSSSPPAEAIGPARSVRAPVEPPPPMQRPVP